MKLVKDCTIIILMNITYNTIIDYLTNNEFDSHYFPTKKNLLKHSNDFPNEFKEFLSNKFFRYGIQVYDNDQNNISLYSSVFHLINKKFIMLDKNDQINYIKKMKDNIKNFLKKNYKNFPLKSKFNKIFSLETIDSNKFNPLLLEILSYSLNINIIIFDFETLKTKVVYYGNFLNLWKPTIFLAKKKNFWEPIYNENNKIFKYNNLIIDIIESMDSYFCESYLEKDLIINDNLMEVIDIEKENDNDYKQSNDSNISNENNKLFINKKNIKLNLTKNKLNKMKKDKLIELVNELNLKISTKGLSKKIIIELILKN